MTDMTPAYFETWEDARAEVDRRRSRADADVIVKCEPSPYGGYRVFNEFVEVHLDGLVDSFTGCRRKKQFGSDDSWSLAPK